MPLVPWYMLEIHALVCVKLDSKFMKEKYYSPFFKMFELLSSHNTLGSLENIFYP